MTTTATTLPQSTTASPQWLRLATILLSAHASVAAWYFVTAAAVVALVLWLVSRYVEPSMSAFSIALQVAIWFPFGVSIMLVASYLRTLVAAGATRRSFLRGGLASALLVGLLYSLVGVGLLLLERGAYGHLGWRHAVTDGGDGLVLAMGVGHHLWGMWLLTSILAVAGLLVGATYLRWGAWATLLLPFTVLLPVVATSFTTVAPHLITTSWEIPSLAFIDGRTGTALGIVAGLAILAAVSIATWLVLRRIPVPPRLG